MTRARILYKIIVPSEYLYTPKKRLTLMTMFYPIYTLVSVCCIYQQFELELQSGALRRVSVKTLKRSTQVLTEETRKERTQKRHGSSTTRHSRLTEKNKTVGNVTNCNERGGTDTLVVGDRGHGRKRFVPVSGRILRGSCCI